MMFADLKRGDVFRLASVMRSDSYEKTGDHQARVVNSAETRNVADSELVYLERSAAPAHRCSNDCEHAIRAVDNYNQPWTGSRPGTP
jgi:hypothetical protein